MTDTLLDSVGVAIAHVAVGLYALSWLTILAWVVYAGGAPDWGPGLVASAYIGVAHVWLNWFEPA